jgi:cob(I)alamin adenosyltransferase
MGNELVAESRDIIPAMSPIKHRAGDTGTTGLLGSGRLAKHHPRIEALGTLDEASAALGLARAVCRSTEAGAILVEVQRDLYAMMSEVAASPENAERFRSLEPARLEWLEARTEAISARAPLPAEFILPGDSLPGAALSLARTIVRRAERCVAGLLDQGELDNLVLLQYLNRLSSLCFALELLENQQAGQSTTLAKK